MRIMIKAPLLPAILARGVHGDLTAAARNARLYTLFRLVSRIPAYP